MKQTLVAVLVLFAFIASAAPDLAALEKALADAATDTRRPRTLVWTFDVGVKELVAARQYETAEKLLDRALALEGLAPRRRFDLSLIRIELLFDSKRRDEARKLGDAQVASKEDPVRAIKAAARAYRENALDRLSQLAYYDRYLDCPEAIGANEVQHRQILKDYVILAEYAMDRVRLEEAEKICEQRGFGKIEGHMGLLPILREAENFPGDEKDVFIPKGLADFGVDPARKVVHAKDFGWNPTNATKCLAKAVNSDATTVIVDDMGSPWYLWSVRFEKQTGSNKQIVFKKGVTVLSAPLHNRKGEPGWYRADMFDLADVSNIVFVGEGELGKDVSVGMYPTRAARYASGFEYGGTCIGGKVRNILVKNLRLANNLSDGFCMRGSHHYLVDCILDDNYRQGLSIVNGHHGVYKNVTFCNTVGGEPHNGVDFEPPYEMYSCHEQRFYDCTFTNNAAGNVIFSIGTFAPVTVLFKRCTFAAGRYNNVSFFEKRLHYAAARRKAPSNIIFEDCRIDGYAESSAVRTNGNVFDLTFRNCTFNERGHLDRTRKPNASPFRLALDSGYCRGYYSWPGRILFDNVKVNGWRGRPLVGVSDFVGCVGINGFAGTVDFNGEKVDMSSFSYLPPDLTLGEAPEPAGRDFVGRVADPNAEAAPGFVLDFTHAWYQPMPWYEYLAAGRRGAKATFRINNIAKPVPTGSFVVRTPSGKLVTAAPAKAGESDYSYVFEEDGVHAFLTKWLDPNLENDGRFYDLRATGVALSYLSVSNESGRVIRIRTAPEAKRYVGYFEVPADRPCSLKLMRGGIEVCDETGASVVRVDADDYAGSKLVTFTPKKSAIWSFRALNARLNFKMFPPLTAIWSDDPENLVTTRAGLPFHRVDPAGEVRAAAPVSVSLPAKYADEADRLAAARLAQAKQGTAVPAYEQAAKDLAEFKKHVDGAGAEREVVDMTTRLNRLKRYADAEKAALAESEETRRMAAFCAKYATVYAPEEIGGWECSVRDDVFTYAHERGLKGLYATVVGRLP